MHGCGNIGHTDDPTCAPFPPRMQFDDCQNYPPWDCGNMSDSDREGSRVRKLGSSRGGALCCRDP